MSLTTGMGIAALPRLTPTFARLEWELPLFHVYHRLHTTGMGIATLPLTGMGITTLPLTGMGITTLPLTGMGITTLPLTEHILVHCRKII